MDQWTTDQADPALSPLRAAKFDAASDRGGAYDISYGPGVEKAVRSCHRIIEIAIPEITM